MPHTAVVDARVAELLCSRLCHELVAPIGAIGNGIELIQEFEDTMRDEAMGLIADSARQAATRLRFYRMAYGFAGRETIADLAAVRELAEALFAGGRITLCWQSGSERAALGGGRGKLLLNMIVLAREALPRGGSVTVGLLEQAGRLRMDVEARGDGARIEPDRAAATAARIPVEELTPHTVHGYFTACIAEALGGRIEIDTANENAVVYVCILGECR